MRWIGLPARQTGELPWASVPTATFLSFFERLEAGEWEDLLTEYTEHARAHPDPARRHFASVSDWGHARTMRDHAGASWDDGNNTVLVGRLPPQYAYRNMVLGHGERWQLERHLLPETHELNEFEVDSSTGPPAVDAWVHALWQQRSRHSMAPTYARNPNIDQYSL